MFGYARLCSGVFGVAHMVRVVHRFVASCYWEMQLQIARRLGMAILEVSEIIRSRFLADLRVR